MDISNAEVQRVNPDFVTAVNPETGPSIMVTGKPRKPTLTVSKQKSVVDDLIDVGETILLNLPPSPGGIKRDVDAARDAAKDMGEVARDGDTLEFDIPIEIPQGHKCNVFFSAQVKTLTEDNAGAEQASASFTMTWDGGDLQSADADNVRLNQMKFIPVSMILKNEPGRGTDHVRVTVNRVVSTDGAILHSPCTSEVTIQQFTFNLEEV